MLVGVPKEIKTHEYRVGLTTGSVSELIHHGHKVIVETNAGAGIGLSDEMYRRVGAEIVGSAAEVFARADMVVKVKEPQAHECRMLREGQVLFTYLHLAPDPEQTRLLLDSGCVAIAYETVTGPGNTLPLLSPMSEVAGRMSIQAGAHCLEKEQGGSGMLLGGVPGVEAAKVVVIGGGVVGTTRSAWRWDSRPMSRCSTNPSNAYGSSTRNLAASWPPSTPPARCWSVSWWMPTS
jgi:alanine dehydrogenase